MSKILSSEELEVYLRSIVSPRLQFFNVSLNELESRASSIYRQMSAIQDRANSQGRRLTAQECLEVEELERQYNENERQMIHLRGNMAENEMSYETMAQAQERTAGASRRLTKPDDWGGRKSLGATIDGAAGSLSAVARNDRLQGVARGDLNHSGTIALPGLRSMLNTLTSEPDSSGADTYNVQPLRTARLGNDPRLALTLLANLPIFPMTESNALEYPKLIDQDSAADRDADYQPGEGQQKKETHFSTEIATAYIDTIAHFTRCSRQVLADVPLLQGQISSLLRYGLFRKVEQELINGDGSGKNIEGLATAASSASVSASAPADRIGEAAVQLALAGWMPDRVLLNPTDFFNIASERSSGDGQYVAGGGWAAPADGSVWGLRKVLSPMQDAGTAIVFDSSQVAVLDRMAATLIVTVEGDYLVTRNLATLLAEIRLGLAIFSPAAIVSVGLGS